MRGRGKQNVEKGMREEKEKEIIRGEKEEEKRNREGEEKIEAKGVGASNWREGGRE